MSYSISSLHVLLCAVLTLGGPGLATAQNASFVLDRGDETLVVEPYAANIVRVTLSLMKEEALRGPGYGINGHQAELASSHPV